jgi:hypothetical protein
LENKALGSADRNPRLRAVASLFVLFAAVVAVLSFAWPLAQHWYEAAYPSAPPAEQKDFFILSHDYYYEPLGGSFTAWIYLGLFCIGMALYGRSLSRARPLVAISSAVITGIAGLYVVVRLLSEALQWVSPLLRPTELEWYLSVSPLFPQGTFGFGVLLAVSAFIASAAARLAVEWSLRLASKPSTGA